MNWFLRTFSYSVGKKLIMSLTGLFLVIYLIEHVIGNLLLLKGDGGDSFRDYSHFMVNNPFIRVIEIVLFICFIFHIIDGLYLFFRNRKARPNRYVVNNPNANSAWSSRNMAVTGTVIFLFLIIHLRQFFLPYRIIDHNTDLYQVAIDTFRNPYYSIFYVIAMILIGFHLHHGFRSAFQTVGARSPKYYPFIRGVGYFLAIMLPLLFSIIPLYFLFTK
jgi:succinate dehydrogenase / fumarate reductase cytochrome b subunit